MFVDSVVALQAGEKVYSTVVKSEVMEGLACPRGSTASQPPQERKVASSLPMVEGLAARFDSYFEKVPVPVPILLGVARIFPGGASHVHDFPKQFQNSPHILLICDKH